MSVKDIKEEKGKGELRNFDDVISLINPDADYTIPQVAELVGVSYSCVLAHAIKEHFPSRKIFGRVYVKGKDLKNYLTKEVFNS